MELKAVATVATACGLVFRAFCLKEIAGSTLRLQKKTQLDSEVLRKCN